jgi:copper(I)-binding protein
MAIGRLGALVVMMAGLLAAPAAAQDLTVKNPRAIVSASDPKDIRVVATISNSGMYGTYLVSATSTAAERVELRDARKQNAVVKEVEVPAFGSLTLDVREIYLKLINPKQPLAAGSRVEVILTNDAQAKIRVVAVAAAR